MHTSIDTNLARWVRSEQCCVSNRAILAATRYRIAASRRRLNRAFALTGGSNNGHETLRASVRSRLASGALFPIGSSVMAGYGKENECVVCRETISAREIEYEIAVGAGVAVATPL
jgi:hypothetical protein